jgi:hypothetical protein
VQVLTDPLSIIFADCFLLFRSCVTEKRKFFFGRLDFMTLHLRPAGKIPHNINHIMNRFFSSEYRTMALTALFPVVQGRSLGEF